MKIKEVNTLKVKALKSLNEDIREGETYTIKTTENGIMLLFYNDCYYLINQNILENNFKIL